MADLKYGIPSLAQALPEFFRLYWVAELQRAYFINGAIYAEFRHDEELETTIVPDIEDDDSA